MNLKKWLLKENVMQDVFAARIGVSQQAISRYVLGQRRPRNPKILTKIERATRGEVTVPELLGIKPGRPYTSRAR